MCQIVPISCRLKPIMYALGRDLILHALSFISMEYMIYTFVFKIFLARK